MKVLRKVITQGVTAPPKEKSHPEIEVTVKTMRVGVGYLDRRKSG
jgi:hypothetical protein